MKILDHGILSEKKRDPLLGNKKLKVFSVVIFLFLILTVLFVFAIQTQSFFEDCTDMSIQWNVNGWASSAGECYSTNGIPDYADTISDFDLNGATDVNVSLYFRMKKLDSAQSDYIALGISNDSANNWVEVWRRDAVGSNDNTAGTDEVSLEEFITFTSNMRLRVGCYSGGGEGCYVDNINITDHTIEALTLALDDSYGLNSSLGRIDIFNTTNLEEIEYMELNFTIDSTETIDSWIFNFTANGTNACSLGNKQHEICYNYSNIVNKWIQFINGTETDTFDGTQPGNLGDGFVVTQTGSGSQINVSLRIDEHYNPNVFKHYGALFDYSEVKWQDGVNQRITNETQIKMHIDDAIIPLDADQYKLDFRVNYTNNPTQSLEAYICNSTYTTGDVHISSECVEVTSKTPSQLQANNFKFRGIFTKNLIDGIGDLGFVILETTETDPTKYYDIKTYNATNSTWTQEWDYSNDEGSSWNNLGDGYEFDLNINWFYAGGSPTEFIYQLWVNTTVGSTKKLEGSIPWSIDATNNYPPLVDLQTPLIGTFLSPPYNIIFTHSDPNDDNLNTTISLYQSETLKEIIATGMNQSNSSFLWSNNTLPGTYNITIETCELGTADLFCTNKTHQNIRVEYGTLNVNITSPTDPTSINQSKLFDLNATVTCEGSSADVKCGTVYALARYDGSSIYRPESYVTLNNVDNPEQAYDNNINDTTTFALLNEVGINVIVNYTYNLPDEITEAEFSVTWGTQTIDLTAFVVIWNFTSGAFENVVTTSTGGIDATQELLSISKDNGYISSTGEVIMQGYGAGTGGSISQLEIWDTYISSEVNPPNTAISTTISATPFYVQNTPEITNILQDWGTENLEDAGVVQGQPTVDQSEFKQLQLNSQTGWLAYIYFKFDISSIPTNAIIEDASLSLYYYDSWDDTPRNIDIHHVYNQTWTDIINWNGHPCGSPFSDATNCNLTSEYNLPMDLVYGYKTWNVYNMLEKTLNDGDTNLSMLLRHIETSGGQEWARFEASENGSTQYMPYLNITYRIVNPQLKTLNQNQQWNVSWNINATGSVGSQWEIDTLFNSSYGNSLVPDNDTNDITINISGEIVDNPPAWSLNSTNSTLAGTNILHSVKWTDDYDLNGYIFSFDNGGGTFVNDSFVSMTGLINWSNVSKLVTSSIGADIRWQVHANDSNGTITSTPIFQYTTTSAPVVSFRGLQYFTGDTGTTVESPIVTDWATDCNTDQTTGRTDIASATAVPSCASRLTWAITDTNTYWLYDLWNNTALSTDSDISYEWWYGHFRESSDVGSYTAKFYGIYTDGSGGIVVMPGEATYNVATSEDIDQNISLAGIDTTNVPSGRKWGLRVNITSTGSTDFRLYMGDTNCAVGTGCGYFLVNVSEAAVAGDAYSGNASVGISLTDSPSRLSRFIKNPLSSLNIIESVKKLAGLTFIIFQQLNIDENIIKIFSTIRDIPQSFTISSLISKISGSIVNIQQSFNLNIILTRFLTAFTLIPQGLNFNIILGKLFIGGVDIQQDIQIDDSSDKTFGTTKQISQSFNFTETISRFASFFKNILQSILMFFTTTTTAPTTNGNVIIELINSTDFNVTNGTAFNFFVNVSCVDDNCGSVNVTLDPIRIFTNYGVKNILTPQDIQPEKFETYKMSIDNGLKVSHDNWSITFKPVFVMNSGATYTWSEIPVGIEKKLWKKQLTPTKFEYGVDFNYVPENIANNLKYLVLHRTDVQNLTASDVSINGTKLIIKGVEIDHKVLLKDYSIVSINKTDIVLGDIQGHNKTICTAPNNCSEVFFNNFVANGDGTFNITFDPTVVIDGETSYNSIDTNITQEAGFAHLNISSASPYDALVGYWTFDENKSIVYDYTSNNNDGTIVNNAIYNDSGVFGGSMYFDSDNDYVNVGNDVSLNLTTQFAISMWFTGDNIAYWDSLIGHSADGVNWDEGMDVWYRTAPDQIRFYVDHYTANAVGIAYTATSDWSHLVVTWNGSDMNIYLNNVSGSTTTFSGTIDYVNSELLIGAFVTDQRYDWGGRIDDVMIFNRGLTVSEVSDIYNNQSARYTNPGTQVFATQDIGQDGTLNRLNITTTTTQQNMSSYMQVRAWEWNGINYNDTIDGDSSTVAQDDGIVGWYHFDNRSGYENDTHVFDWSGNENNATATNGAFVNISGKYNSAMQFDGINDYVVVPSDSSMDGVNGTISFWIKTDGVWETDAPVADNTAMVFGRHGASQSRDGINILQRPTTSTGKILVDVKNSTTSVLTITGSSDLTDDEWHYITFVYTQINGGNNTLYVDGVADVSGTNSQGWAFDNQDIIFADSPDAFWEYWAGQIDEVLIWNKSLSASEIKDQYFKGRLKYTKSSYTNITSGVEQVTTLTIDTGTELVIPEFKYNTDSNNFYSPLLLGNITIDSWSALEGALSKGIIPEDAGNPFYVDSSYRNNPFTITSLNQDESVMVNWSVMPNGTVGNIYKFFAFANSSVSSNTSGIVNITISEAVGDSFTRDIAQSFNLGDILNRFLIGIRNPSQIISIDIIMDRISSAIREISQAFSINTLINKIKNGFIDISQYFNIGEYLNKLFGAFRTQTDSVTLTDSIDKQADLTKNPSDSFNIIEYINKLFSGTRNVQQDIIFGNYDTTTDGLISWWTFDYDYIDNTTTFDKWGNNDGTIYNATLSELYIDDFDKFRNTINDWADSDFEKQSVALTPEDKIRGTYSMRIIGNSTKQSVSNYTSFQSQINQDWSDYYLDGSFSTWIKYENPGDYNISTVTVNFGDVISGPSQTNYTRCRYQYPEQDNKWHKFTFYLNISKNPGGYDCATYGAMNWSNIKNIRFNFDNSHGFPDEILYSFLVDDIKLTKPNSSIIDTAVEFDGIDDYINLGIINEFSEGITFSAWLKTNHQDLSQLRFQAEDYGGTTGDNFYIDPNTYRRGRQGIDTPGGTLIEFVIPNTNYGSQVIAIYGYQTTHSVVAGTFTIKDNVTGEVLGSGNLGDRDISDNDKRMNSPYIFEGKGHDYRVYVNFSDNSDVYLDYINWIPSGYNGIIEKDSSFEIAYTGNQYRVYINGVSQLANIGSVTSNWQHLIITYNNSIVKAYLDGIFIKSSAYSSPINSNSNSFKLGTYNGFNFWGSIDEVRIYNRSLTQAEITQIYESTSNERQIGLSKTLGANRNPSDNLILTFTFDRIGNLKNNIQQSISINTLSDRFYSSIKSLSQTFSIDTLTDRIKGSFVSISQLLNIETQLNKLGSFFKNTLVSINIFASPGEPTGINKFIQNIYQTISIDTLIDRTTSLTKGISQSFSINVLTERVSGIIKGIDQSLNIDEFINRIFGAFRTQDDSITINEYQDNVFSGERGINDIINVDSSIDRNFDGKKGIEQSFSLQTFLDSIFGGTRTQEDSFTITDSIDRQADLTKNPTQSIVLNIIIDRTSSFQKGITDSILFNINLNTIFFDVGEIFKRDISQSLNIQTFLDRIFGGLRTQTDSFNLVESITKLFSGTKNPSDSIIITDSIDRNFEGKKGVSQSLLINILVDRTSNFNRETTQLISINILTDRLSNLNKNIQQTFSFNIFVERISSFQRGISDSLTFNTFVDAIYIDIGELFSRVINVDLTFTDFLDRLFGGLRTQSDDLTFTESTDRQADLEKNPSDSFSILEYINKLFSGTRTQTDGLIITDSLDSTLGANRNIQDNLILSLTIDRLSNLNKNIQQTISLNIISERTAILTKGIDQSFNIQTLLDRLFGGLRTQTDSITITDSTERQTDLTKNPSDSFSILEYISKLFSGTRTQADGLTITDSTERTFSANRNIQDNVFFNIVTDRVANIQRSINQNILFSLNVPEPSGIQKFLRDIQQSISIDTLIERTSTFTRTISDTLNFILNLIGLEEEIEIIIPKLGGGSPGTAGTSINCYKIVEDSCVFEGFTYSCPENYFNTSLSCETELIKRRIPEIPKDINEIIDSLGNEIMPSNPEKGRNLVLFIIMIFLFAPILFVIFKKIKLKEIKIKEKW